MIAPSIYNWEKSHHGKEPAFDNQQQVILGLTVLQATQVFGMPMDSHLINTKREDVKTNAFAQAILAQIDPSRASCSESQL